MSHSKKITAEISAKALRTFSVLKCIKSINVEHIDAQKAAEYLKVNTRNRKVRANLVKLTSTSFEEDGVAVTSDCIAFDENNVLLNGQHRLYAVLKTSIPLTAIVIRGLHSSFFPFIDQGGVRNVRDLTLWVNKNIKSSSDKTGMPATLLGLESMRPESSWTKIRWSKGHTRQELAKYVVEHDKEFSWALPLVHNKEGNNLLLPRARFASLAVFLGRKHKTATVAFFRQLASGEGLHRGHAILAFRNYLISQLRKQSEARDPLPYRLALAIITWNAWLEGKSMLRMPKLFREVDGVEKYIDWPIPKRPGNYRPWLDETDPDE